MLTQKDIQIIDTKIRQANNELKGQLTHQFDGEFTKLRVEIVNIKTQMTNSATKSDIRDLKEDMIELKDLIVSMHQYVQNDRTLVEGRIYDHDKRLDRHDVNIKIIKTKLKKLSP